MPFLLEHLDYVRSDTEIIANVSGVHTSRLAKRFQEEFNIKLVSFIPMFKLT